MSSNQMKIYLVLIIISIFLEAKIVQRMQVVMGTFVTIKIDEKYQKKIDEGFMIARAVDNSLSTFKETSVIAMLNKNTIAKLDALSYEALLLSKKYYKDTDGYFNIAIGKITKDLYRFGGNERLVDEKSLNASHIDLLALRFDKSQAHIPNDMKLDLGGMGKGFAIDKVSEYFIEAGVDKAILSASGDIRCLSRCSVSVQDPFSEGILLHFRTTKQNSGITTSGNYNRYIKDKTHNHLLNPKTKHSQQNFASITLVGEMKSSALDAYATAVSVMPKDKAYRFLDALDVAYVVVEVGGKMVLKNSDFFEVE